MLNFSVILEHNNTHKLTFVDVEDCVDLEDCVNHIHSNFPNQTIEQIKQK